ncbi:uncharacterized protein LOC129772668 [Toxorhynchites rutilus septentrionalis]|uniref:uncharacterized protein LOC129772668 n=1 Tax=Toxorhynchites rutilus septentrionalis TaxID=329112 RepID=UPI002479CCA5|nr:uncharacterized protein LOC129772668 [Toxorhynchites rutilus septentrionalis]
MPMDHPQTSETTGLSSKHSKKTQTEELGFKPGPLPIPLEQTDYCRLCFTIQRLQPLCSGRTRVRDDMLDMIYACTGILIIPKRKKIFFICQNCAQTISNFYMYQQQICSNNRALVAYHARNINIMNFPTDNYALPTVQETPATKMRKVPIQVQMRTEESTIDISDGTISDTVDPLMSLDEPSSESRSDALFLEILPEDTQTIALKSEPPDDSLNSDDSSEVELWDCWQCGTTFAFKFECAKHLLQAHREDVSLIGRRLELDELNRNMLEMMSKCTRVQATGSKRKIAN